MRHAYLLVLLGCALRLSPVGAQHAAPSAPAPSAPAPSVPVPFVPAQNDEAQLKGVIWTATAEQAWQDLKLPQSKKPKRWNTPDDFESWRKQHAKNDLAGLLGLHDKVLKFVKQKPVSPTELKAAILHEIGSLNYEGRHVDKEKLAEALNKVASPAKVGKSVSPKPDSVAKDEGNALGAGNASADALGATAQTMKTKSNTTTKAATDTPVFPWPLILTGLAGFLLGLMGAAALRQFLRRQQALEEKQEARQRESEKLKHYKDENTRLEREIQKLRKQNAQLQTESRENTQPTPRPQNVPLTGPSVATAVAEPAVPVPTSGFTPTAPPPTNRAKFYTSAAPGGILEHDKLATQSMGRMALLVELNGQNPHNARFTLNPDVDKSWLIAADLEKLRDYFTFTLPADRWPSSVEATAPGTLTREGNGWKVGKKATLTVR